MLYTTSLWMSSVIMLLGTLWYCRLLWLGKVQPPPATFLILSLMFGLSFFMYAQKATWSFGANIGLTVSTLSVWMVTPWLMGLLAFRKKLRVEFNPFQWKMITAALVTMVFWLLTDDHFISYVLLQVIAVIGYVPTMVRLWKAKKNTDSLVFWLSVFFAVLVASYAAWLRNDIEAWIYIARAVPCVMIIIVLMIRLEIKKGI